MYTTSTLGLWNVAFQQRQFDKGRAQLDFERGDQFFIGSWHGGLF